MFDYYYEADVDAIASYNNGQKLNSPTLLRVEMGAAPYDGDPFAAQIVLLLNNPTFTIDSVPEDHRLKFDGWPLAGLHPCVREGFRDWYNRPLGYLIKRFGAQSVSQRIAILQIIPWASKSFDIRCELPSRERQVAIATEAVNRGAIVIIGRSTSFWRSKLGQADNIYTAKNARNPTITPKGLGISDEMFDARISTLFR
ncbi:hypothetical protein ACNHKD_00405 [Methylocystis sp. JAN1]|uniref:hypothetical protein n=1 Tax=Methylocystis sp. JAN1 TaxID=3397211 RepID=UPI003FA29F55